MSGRPPICLLFGLRGFWVNSCLAIRHSPLRGLSVDCYKCLGLSRSWGVCVLCWVCFFGMSKWFLVLYFGKRDFCAMSFCYFPSLARSSTGLYSLWICAEHRAVCIELVVLRSLTDRPYQFFWVYLWQFCLSVVTFFRSLLRILSLRHGRYVYFLCCVCSFIFKLACLASLVLASRGLSFLIICDNCACFFMQVSCSGVVSL